MEVWGKETVWVRVLAPISVTHGTWANLSASAGLGVLIGEMEQCRSLFRAAVGTRG